jgi:hypothetical protein
MTPKWKKAGPNGEQEIKFPTGRKFLVEKQLDANLRHRGEWKVMEWDARTNDWEWGDTYSPKGYAKEMVMKMGQYDKRGKKVADYSKTFKFESVDEEVTTTADAGIPHDTKDMGPSRLPTNILRRDIGRPINVTDRRRRKDKTPRILKKFRKYIDG